MNSAGCYRIFRDDHAGTNRRGTIGHLLSHARAGNREAVNELIEDLYPELRRLAAARMRRERPGHTLQPTALVHELYLELAKARASGAGNADPPDDKRQFIGFGGVLVMRLLIHHARPLYRRVEKLGVEAADLPREPSADNLAELEDLLRRLESIDPHLRAVVEMKVFEGCSM